MVEGKEEQGEVSHCLKTFLYRHPTVTKTACSICLQ